MKKIIPPSKYLLEQLAVILAGGVSAYQGDSPTSEKQMGEQVLGTLKDPISKALWQFMTKLSKDGLAQVSEADALERDDKAGAEDLYRLVDSATDMAKACNALFWVRVQTEFPQGHLIGLSFDIRKDWEVVVMKSRSPFHVLAAFAGGSQG